MAQWLELVYCQELGVDISSNLRWIVGPGVHSTSVQAVLETKISSVLKLLFSSGSNFTF